MQWFHQRELLSFAQVRQPASRDIPVLTALVVLCLPLTGCGRVGFESLDFGGDGVTGGAHQDGEAGNGHAGTVSDATGGQGVGGAQSGGAGAGGTVDHGGAAGVTVGSGGAAGTTVGTGGTAGTTVAVGGDAGAIVGSGGAAGTSTGRGGTVSGGAAGTAGAPLGGAVGSTGVGGTTQGGTAGTVGSGGLGPAGAAGSPGSGGNGPGGTAGSAGAGGTVGAGGTGVGGAGGFGGATSYGTCFPHTFNGHDYTFCDGEGTWEEARVACRSRGLRLARIDDAVEDDWVASTSALHFGAGGRVYAWAGGSDLAVEGEWRWEDGDQFWEGEATGVPIGGLYTNWRNGDPNNLNDVEHCLAINITNTPDWIDYECQLVSHVVCELY